MYDDFEKVSKCLKLFEFVKMLALGPKNSFSDIWLGFGAIQSEHTKITFGQLIFGLNHPF